MTVSKRPAALLALADGSLFEGEAFGALRGVDQPVIAEVVFNTAMYGYQEILTDPSYAGQLMCFTYPHIGNVGCNVEDAESRQVFVEAVAVRSLPRTTSNFRATRSFEEYLTREGRMGICGIDTRALVSHLRDHGAQMGALAVADRSQAPLLVAAAQRAQGMEGCDLVRNVSCDQPYSWNRLPWRPDEREERVLSEEALSSRPHVVAIDCGVKRQILSLLLESGFRVTVVPATYSAEQVLALNPDALFLSNGPGDPAALSYVVSTTRDLIGRFPIFGICLGHQILAQAVGGKTYKLKFGHRGGNHPVKDLTTGKVEITVQNHGFAVDADSLPPEARITHINLNDQTVEGLELPAARAFSIQYHPEASPGPHDSRYLFRRFFESVVEYRHMPASPGR